MGAENKHPWARERMHPAPPLPRGVRMHLAVAGGGKRLLAALMSRHPLLPLHPAGNIGPAVEADLRARILLFVAILFPS